ncbi:ragulator complex protein LAMTOR4-like [Watersipora subatra]|uniref:ragulator complex protein LAMTOR4-like n=1 Tax=Watersipora subatra TaxID=2589382 RepID=UPI00355B189A
MSQQLEQIAGSLGYLEMDGDGNILKSGGELENEERMANHFYDLFCQCVQFPLEPTDELRRVSVNYNEFCFVMMASSGHLFVVKRMGKLQEPAIV